MLLYLPHPSGGYQWAEKRERARGWQTSIAHVSAYPLPCVFFLYIHQFARFYQPKEYSRFSNTDDILLQTVLIERNLTVSFQNKYILLIILGMKIIVNVDLG